MAERAGAAIIEAEGSHVVMVSRPEVVADVILRALDAVRNRSDLAVRRSAGSDPR
jgi:hypothetical protein